MDIVWLAGIVITVATAVPVFLQMRHHPRGLFVLFFAEMWERFSYYGMRGLLIFYLTQHFLFDDNYSQGQYGAYTAMVYLLPLIGGLMADRFLGTRKAIAFGALLLVAGHFSMAIEGGPARQTLIYQGQTYDFQSGGEGRAKAGQLKVGDSLYDYGPTQDGGLEIRGLAEGGALPPVLAAGSYQLGVADRDPFYVNIFYLSLSLIIMGVGFLKPNISSIVGQLYREGDPRRDSGFTLYYYGINLGAFWASIACGWLGQNVGWWAGFGAAGVGMLAGYVMFVFGRPLLEGHGEPPDPARLRAPLLGPLSMESTIYLASLVGVLVVFVIVRRFEAVGVMLAAGSVLVLGYLGWFMVTKCTKVERERMGLALVLIAGSVVFFTLFEQAGSSLNQFADRNTNLAITATQSITAAQTQSFNAGFILLLAPLFAATWTFLGRRNLDPNPVVKFGLALLLVGAGFFVVVWGAQFADATYKVPLIFLLLLYFLHTTGELSLSPVGLSQMTKLSVPVLVSTVMAVWFLASSWAQWIGGLIAQMTGAETVGGEVLDPAKALQTYVEVFTLIGAWGAGLGVLLLVLSPWLSKWAHGANDLQPEPVGGGEKPSPAVAARAD